MKRLILFISLVSIAGLYFIGCSRERKSSSVDEDITDDSLLTLVQYRTFRYFWDGAEPNSWMARERIHMDGVYPENDMNVVTSGGS